MTPVALRSVLGVSCVASIKQIDALSYGVVSL